MSKIYEANIKHNPDTVKLLFKTSYYAYNLKIIALKIIAGVLLNIISLTMNMSNAMQALMIMLGCFLIISKDFSHNYKSSEVIETRKNNLPSIKTEFYENHLKIIGENGGTINYSKIDKLIIKDNYFFLFISHDIVSMIDIDTLKPEDWKKFENFISKKTNKNVSQLKGVMSITLKDLIKR